VGAKAITEDLQFTAQLGEVVNFAIEDDGQTPLRQMHGLMTQGGEIEDG
jgi:hypothetical protein